MNWPVQTRSPVVAVLSGRDVGPAGSGSVTEAALTEEVRVLGRFDAETVLAPESGSGLAARLERLPDRFRAVLLVEVDPVQAREAGERAAEHGLRLVVSDQDGAATALCAAVLTHLRAVRRSVDLAKVVIADGGRLPSLAPLLMIAGVYDLLMWQDADAATFPWEQMIRDADVVIDLRPGSLAAAETARMELDRPEGSVLRPADAEWGHHIVAGVLRVALACPPGSMHVGLGMLRACAFAIVAATSSSHRARITDSAITDVVASAVRRSIDPRLAARGVTNDEEEI